MLLELTLLVKQLNKINTNVNYRALERHFLHLETAARVV